jgi:hypothetical protein
LSEAGGEKIAFVENPSGYLTANSEINGYPLYTFYWVESFPEITEPENIATSTTTPSTASQDPNQSQTRPPNTNAGIIETIPIPIFLKRSMQGLLRFF